MRDVPFSFPPSVFLFIYYNGDMIKRVLALIILIGFGGYVAVTSWPGFVLPALDFVFESATYSKNPDLMRLSQAVVRVNVVFQDDDAFGSSVSAGQRTGTGFNIDPTGLIVTNHHVVSGATAITVEFPDGPVYPAANWRSLPDLDLAVIELGFENLPALQWVPNARPSAGERVTVIGHPLGMQSIITRGTVASYLRLGMPAPVMVLTNTIHAGNSGSPVINDAEQVVAVVFGSLRYDTGEGPGTRGLAVPLQEAADFIIGREEGKYGRD